MSTQMTDGNFYNPVPTGIRPPSVVLQQWQDETWAVSAVRQLSQREREILPLLAARWTDREIADALCISYRTVTTHVAHIFDKLGINSRRAAAAFAHAAGSAFD